MSHSTSVRIGRAVVVAVSLSLVAGCGSDKDAASRCPRVLILSDAANLTRFASGGGQDLLDVDHEVEIADVQSECKVAKGENGKPVALVALAPVMVATRGPANRDREVRFNYFVSVVNSDRAILNKQTFDVAVQFPGNRSRVVIKDDDPPVSINIPIASPDAGSGYEVLVGLQLTPDELERNLRRRGAAR